MKARNLLGVIGLAVGLAATSAQASVIDLGAVADAPVRAVQPNTNFGTNDILGVRNDSSVQGRHRKAYLRFDLSSVAGVMIDAEFSLTLESTTNTPVVAQIYNVFGLDDLDPGESWGETAITWNNAPANDTTSGGGLLGNATLLGTFSVPITAVTGDTFSLSNAALLSFLQADTNGIVTLIVTRQNASDVINSFASRENVEDAAVPNLRITTVPAPATLGLVLLALPIALARRRAAA